MPFLYGRGRASGALPQSCDRLSPTTWATATSAASARRATRRRTSTAWPRRACASPTSTSPRRSARASRAALLTGCYPNRVGILGALGPASKNGIHDDEMTLAEVLKQQRLRHGRSSASGTSAISDSSCRRGTASTTTSACPTPTTCGRSIPTGRRLPRPAADRGREDHRRRTPTRRKLTTWYTERAVQFIDEQQGPAVLPLRAAHHAARAAVRLATSSRASRAGAVRRRDRGDRLVGRRRSWRRSKKHGLDEQHAGDLHLATTARGCPTATTPARPARCARARARPGRAACACRASCAGRARSPPAHVCREPAMTIDLLPTLAKLAGGELPEHRRSTASDIWPLLSGEPERETPHEAYYFYWGRELQAVRSGDVEAALPARLPHPGRRARPRRPAGRRPAGADRTCAVSPAG